MAIKSRKVGRKVGMKMGEEGEKRGGHSTTLAEMEDRVKGRKRVRSQLRKGNRGGGVGLIGRLLAGMKKMGTGIDKMPSEKDINKGLWG